VIGTPRPLLSASALGHGRWPRIIGPWTTRSSSRRSSRSWTQPYKPAVVGYLNDHKLQIVKAKGPFVWHKHDDTDDLFLVVEGRPTIHLRDRDVELRKGELFVVPRGVEHCPSAAEETLVLLVEPRGTPNTGDAGGALTSEPIEL
jgi:mannose-6-phosphate isomerase-like protein (cupin superfamily)